MKVYGELSFYILITCLTFSVNKQVQASDKLTTESKVDEKVQAEEDPTTKSKANEHGTETSQSDQPVKSRAVLENTDEDTTDEEAKEFFDSFARPKPPRISKIDFVQKLDHFDHFNDRTWIQRAYLDCQYENDDGPVLLIIGRLNEILPQELEDQSIVLLAKRYHAPMYILEHRYHGASVPTDLGADNLESYLRSEQALADIDFFIKKSKHATRKWVIFGKGYGGTLAAWFRLKYPHVASSALAFSSPLYAMTEEDETFKAVEDFPKDVQLTLCNAFDEIRAAITRNEYTELKEKFNMCTKLDEGNNTNDNVIFMYWSILHYLITISVVNDKETIQLLISDLIKNPLDRLASVVKKCNGGNCLSVNYGDAINKYNNLNIKYYKDIDYPISLKVGLGSRPQFYQRCTEYGLFETDKNGQNTFGVKIHLDFYTKLCEQAFGRKFDSDIYGKAIDTTNMLYGGHNIAATNLIYISPYATFWNSIGMAKSKLNESIQINYNDADPSILKREYDLIIGKLDEWMGKKSERGGNGAGSPTEKVEETVVSQLAAAEDELKTVKEN